MTRGAVSVNAVILWSRDPRRVAAFYRMVGLPLEDEDHGDGHVHQACDVDGVHVAVYGAQGGGGDAKVPGRREAGGQMIGLRVASLERVAEALRAAGEYRELVARERMEWGERVVLLDPDGRPVELTQE